MNQRRVEKSTFENQRKIQRE